MKKLLTVTVVGLLGWYAYTKYQNYSSASARPEEASAESELSLQGLREQESSPRITCDGRTRCSQMKSCAEATYFIRNCPGVEMDGDRDGVPCESQWCAGG